MKKIVVICLVLSMLLGAVGCSKTKEKPTLADTFAVFEDKSLTYDPELYPYEFSQEEIDNADDESIKKANDLYDFMLNYISYNQEKVEELGVSGVVNKIFLIDYVLRAGLHLDQEEFRNRYALIDDLIMTDGRDRINSMFFSSLIYEIPDGDITGDVADCIVPVMREHLPDLNDKKYTESKEMATNALFAQFFYRDALHRILWVGKGEEAGKEWDNEAYDRIEQWGKLVKSFPDD